VAFPDGRLATSSKAGVVAVWKMGTTTPYCTAAFQCPAHDMVALPDGRLVCADVAGNVFVCTINQTSSIRRLEEPIRQRADAFHMAANANGTVAFLRSTLDSSDARRYSSQVAVNLWNPATDATASKFLVELGFHGVALLPEGLLAAWETAKIDVWDTTTRAVTASLHSAPTNAVVGLLDHRLAIANRGGLFVWAMEGGAVQQLTTYTYEQRQAEVVALALLPGGRLAAGCIGGDVQVWCLSTSACLATLKGHTRAITSLMALPDGRLASASGSVRTVSGFVPGDNNVRLWDVVDYTCVATLAATTRYAFTMHPVEDAPTAAASASVQHAASAGAAAGGAAAGSRTNTSAGKM